jgi:formylglycine-generating enzyme required for sulfatase activity
VYGSPQASCANLAATCGPSGNENCCTTITVPGGTFNRDNDPTHPATVADFSLDKYEVTVGRFRAFMKAGMGTQTNPPPVGAGAHPLISGTGWDSAWNTNLVWDATTLGTLLKCKMPFVPWTDHAGANENLPINCTYWYEAFAFCAWDGGRLPTEAEWDYAAVGGGEQREYPWGAAVPDPSLASYDCLADGSQSGAINPDNCVLPDILSVGSLPAGNGRWGHADLAGSMWEFNLDWYSSSFPIPCANCANTKAATERVARGGDFKGGASALRSTGSYSRTSADPRFRYMDLGFRCARNNL